MEEKELCNAIAYRLFEEFCAELASQTEAEKQEDREALSQFAKLEGVKEESLYARIFWGFRGGVGKGLELADRLAGIQENAAEV